MKVGDIVIIKNDQTKIPRKIKELHKTKSGITYVELEEKTNWYLEDHLELYSEETVGKENFICYEIPNNYEFSGIENGRAIFIKKKSSLIPSIDECFDIVFDKNEDQILEFCQKDLIRPYGPGLIDLYRLLVCRNAIWKVFYNNWKGPKAGDDTSSFGKIVISPSFIVYFPDEVFVEAFKERFKSIIEAVRTLL